MPPTFHIATGWSNKTVTSNLFLTGPKISKSAITQWFLGSLYREVLVFWCFKSVRLVEFCLLEHFHYRAMAAPYKAWTEHLYTPWVTSKPYKHFFLGHKHMHRYLPTDTSSRYLETIQDNNGHQQTPNDANRRSQAPKTAVQGHVAAVVDIEWHLLVSVGVWRHLLVSYGVWRCEKGSKCFLREYLSAV